MGTAKTLLGMAAEASRVIFRPNGNVSSTNVQDAIEEVESEKQSADPTLTALASLDATSGLLTQTGTDAFAKRTITAPTAGLTVSEGSGTAGNPTLGLANDLAAVEGLSSTGLVRRTGVDTWTAGAAVSSAELGANAVTADAIDAGAVGSSELADNAVGLTEMAHGTQGDILYYGVSGEPTRMVAGTAGQILETQGPGAIPRWVTPATTSGRELLAADKTFYVSPSGSDSNDGLSVGQPFLTAQFAADLIADRFDTGAYDAIIQYNDATHVTGVFVKRPFVTGTGEVIFRGNTTTPANCVIAAGAVLAAFNCTFGASFRVEGFKIADATTVDALYASAGGILRVTNKMEYGGTTTSHIHAHAQGAIIVDTEYTISGGSAVHARASGSGVIEVAIGTNQITVTGTPVFTGNFAFADSGQILWTSGAFSGSATGRHYVVGLNGVINTGGEADTFFPGDTIHLVDSGGQYN